MIISYLNYYFPSLLFLIFFFLLFLLFFGVDTIVEENRSSFPAIEHLSDIPVPVTLNKSSLHHETGITIMQASPLFPMWAPSTEEYR